LFSNKTFIILFNRKAQEKSKGSVYCWNISRGITDTISSGANWQITITFEI